MKALLYRITALLLAVLLLCSAGSGLSFAALDDPPDPFCVLGADPKDMLAGGGKTLHTERGVFFVGDDGCVHLLSAPSATVLEGPVSGLNYGDGVLYFARENEGCFDLCSFDMETGTEAVLLTGFSGQLGQLWLVDNTYLDFSCGNAVWQLELDSGAYRLIQYIDGLWSFVPTAAGLLYATGSLFDYNLYADGLPLAEHVSDYRVETDRDNWLVVYTQEGRDYQASLAAAFAGAADAWTTTQAKAIKSAFPHSR